MRVEGRGEGVHDLEEAGAAEGVLFAFEGEEVVFELVHAAVECACRNDVSAGKDLARLEWFGVGLTVLLDLMAHDALLAGCLVNLEEETGFFIVVVFFYQAVPGESVGDEIWDVFVLDSRCLLVYAVKAPNEGVVADAHVGSFLGKLIGLITQH